MVIERSHERSATEGVIGAPLVLVAEHDGGAPLGSLRAPLVGEGVDVVVWNASSASEPPVQRFDGLIVLGGGANPDGSGDGAPLELEQDLILRAHGGGTPVLGICLGAQLASLALGGRCYPSPQREHGWCDVELTEAASSDRLFGGLDARQTVMQWHAWAFEPPPGATELVRNAVCSQGFRAGRTTWGLQFHPEVSAPQLEAQFAVSRGELASWGFSADRMLADTHRHLPAQLALTTTHCHPLREGGAGMRHMTGLLDTDRVALIRASRSRDARFDGRFIVGVTTTGVYCRPSCPAPSPKDENVRFFATPEAARNDGLRACLRCRPDEPAGRDRLAVARALSAGSTTARPSGLARAAGVTEGRLRTLFLRHVGATPSDLCGQLRTGGGLALRLPFRAPLTFEASLDYLGFRAFRGVEEVADGVYRRTVRAPSGPAVLELGPVRDGHVVARVSRVEPGELSPIVAAARRMLDLDADPAVIDADLAAGARLADGVRRLPGLRLTGAFDPFELAVRAILGQQVSVRGATTLAGRLVERFGDSLPAPDGSLTHLFPTPASLAGAPVESIGMPRARGEAIRSLARAVVDGLDLGPGADPAALRAGLVALPGIGPWTAEYVAMRAAGDPDAFPASDLGLRIALGNGRPATAAEVARSGETWRPWRSYAAMRLWESLGTAG